MTRALDWVNWIFAAIVDVGNLEYVAPVLGTFKLSFMSHK